MYQKLLNQITSDMNKIEYSLRTIRIKGFDNMTAFETAFYESECEYWDRLKHDRNLLKQLIREEIDQDKYNE